MSTIATSPPVLISAAVYEEDIKNGEVTASGLIDRAQQLGAAGVEYRPYCFVDGRGELKECRTRAEADGLLLTYAGTQGLYAGTAEIAEQLLRDLEDAAELGAQLVRVFTGAGLSAESGRIAAARAVERARDLGLRLVVENFVRVPGNTLAEVEQAVAELDPAVVGVNVDIGNYYKNGQDPLAAVDRLHDRIRYSHFKDIADGPAGPVTTYPGNGGLPLTGIVARLRSLAPVPLIALEYAGGSQADHRVSQGLDYFR
jgi:sugar phosphate isomerase/epimerase